MIAWNDVIAADKSLLLAHGRAPTYSEGEGSIRIIEFSDLDPYFVPCRVFEIRDVPGEMLRANHAHKECWQLFMPNFSAYAIEVTAPSGESAEMRLDPWGDLVIVPPGRWVRVLKMQREAVLTVMASHPWDPDDYLHSFEDFRAGA